MSISASSAASVTRDSFVHSCTISNHAPLVAGKQQGQCLTLAISVTPCFITPTTNYCYANCNS